MKTATTLRLAALTALAAVLNTSMQAQVGVNSTGAAPNPRAMMDVSSTTKGLLIPRMTEAQRNAIPATNQQS